MTRSQSHWPKSKGAAGLPKSKGMTHNTVLEQAVAGKGHYKWNIGPITSHVILVKTSMRPYSAVNPTQAVNQPYPAVIPTQPPRPALTTHTL